MPEQKRPDAADNSGSATHEPWKKPGQTSQDESHQPTSNVVEQEKGKKGTMPRSHEDDGHERHGSVAGAAWIFLAIVTALIVVTGVYRRHAYIGGRRGDRSRRERESACVIWPRIRSSCLSCWSVFCPGSLVWLSGGHLEKSAN